ncbi:hypothetical protein CRUP_015581 [Coryphaenoides rupestris]|nr:hypothetical protein CRUP_015581 [Coryphaenoides rupestris]
MRPRTSTGLCLRWATLSLPWQRARP